MTKSRIAIFASGSGTNAEVIFKHFANHPTIEVVLLLSNNAEAYALVRAQNHDIPHRVFNRSEYKDPGVFLKWLRDSGVTHIVLAGFLWLIPKYLIDEFTHHIINIHPALLPKYGGKGMFGSRVHEEVKRAGEGETGITIHLVDEKYDEGKILFQARCPVAPDDSPETIAGKVHQLEYTSYSKVIENWIAGEPPDL